MISGLLFGCWSPAMMSPLPPVRLLPVLAPLSIRNPDDCCGGGFVLLLLSSPYHLHLFLLRPSAADPCSVHLFDSIRPAYKAIGLDEILAKPCSILPSVGSSVLGALFSSKAAYSWMIPGSSCGVYITSINLVFILCSNGALELASWCLPSSLTEGI